MIRTSSQCGPVYDHKTSRASDAFQRGQACSLPSCSCGRARDEPKATGRDCLRPTMPGSAALASGCAPRRRWSREGGLPEAPPTRPPAGAAARCAPAALRLSAAAPAAASRRRLAGCRSGGGCGWAGGRRAMGGSGVSPGRASRGPFALLPRACRPASLSPPRRSSLPRAADEAPPSAAAGGGWVGGERCTGLGSGGAPSPRARRTDRASPPSPCSRSDGGSSARAAITATPALANRAASRWASSACCERTSRCRSASVLARAGGLRGGEGSAYSVAACALPAARRSEGSAAGRDVRGPAGVARSSAPGPCTIQPQTPQLIVPARPDTEANSHSWLQFGHRLYATSVGIRTGRRSRDAVRRGAFPTIAASAAVESTGATGRSSGAS